MCPSIEKTRPCHYVCILAKHGYFTMSVKGTQCKDKNSGHVDNASRKKERKKSHISLKSPLETA